MLSKTKSQIPWELNYICIDCKNTCDHLTWGCCLIISFGWQVFLLSPWEKWLTLSKSAVSVIGWWKNCSNTTFEGDIHVRSRKMAEYLQKELSLTPTNTTSCMSMRNLGLFVILCLRNGVISGFTYNSCWRCISINILRTECQHCPLQLAPFSD